MRHRETKGEGEDLASARPELLDGAIEDVLPEQAVDVVLEGELHVGEDDLRVELLEPEEGG